MSVHTLKMCTGDAAEFGLVIIVKLCLLNKNGWDILYATYPRIENKTNFIYPLEKAASGALWISFWVQNIQRT